MLEASRPHPKHTMGQSLDKLSIRGFKSIAELDELELTSLNVLIGANGAGKSNFIEFFRLLRAMADERLALYAGQRAPVAGFFYGGLGETDAIEAEMAFGDNNYRFRLEPTADEGLMVASEATLYKLSTDWNVIGSGHRESQLKQRRDDSGIATERGQNWYVYNAIAGWRVYHFHDTSATAGMRRQSGVLQGNRLDPDGDNLAAFLMNLKERHQKHYEVVLKTVRRIAPYLDDFDLRVSPGAAEDQVALTWRKRGSDYLYSPGHLSDGTIRFICLAAALLQPAPPSTILLDEPELGLHPEALIILAGLMRSASAHTQLIVATQSPVLLSGFDPQDVITVDHLNGASRFRRLGNQELAAWLEDYSLGELWEKGTIAGGIHDA